MKVVLAFNNAAPGHCPVVAAGSPGTVRLPFRPGQTDHDLIEDAATSPTTVILPKEVTDRLCHRPTQLDLPITKFVSKHLRKRSGYDAARGVLRLAIGTFRDHQELINGLSMRVLQAPYSLPALRGWFDVDDASRRPQDRRVEPLRRTAPDDRVADLDGPPVAVGRETRLIEHESVI